MQRLPSFNDAVLFIPLTRLLIMYLRRSKQVRGAAAAAGDVDAHAQLHLLARRHCALRNSILQALLTLVNLHELSSTSPHSIFKPSSAMTWCCCCGGTHNYSSKLPWCYSCHDNDLLLRIPNRRTSPWAPPASILLNLQQSCVCMHGNEMSGETDGAHRFRLKLGPARCQARQLIHEMDID